MSFIKFIILSGLQGSLEDSDKITMSIDSISLWLQSICFPTNIVETWMPKFAAEMQLEIASMCSIKLQTCHSPSYSPFNVEAHKKNDLLCNNLEYSQEKSLNDQGRSVIVLNRIAKEFVTTKRVTS